MNLYYIVTFLPKIFWLIKTNEMFLYVNLVKMI